MRALMKGQPVDEARVAEIGLSLETIQDIVDRMKRAKFGVIFFGMGLSMTRGKHMNSAGILNIAAEMNAFTKFVCMPMRGHGNVTGADVVLRWTTGYPFGINLSRGYPRFNPGEFSTVDVLVRGDNDATFVLGADPGATMPQPAIEHLKRTPTIVCDPKVTHTSRLARVHFTTAVSGVSAPGTVYRMDEIPISVRPALKSPYHTDEEIVNLIIAAVAKKPGFRPAADRGDGGDRLDGNGSSSPAARLICPRRHTGGGGIFLGAGATLPYDTPTTGCPDTMYHRVRAKAVTSAASASGGPIVRLKPDTTY